DQNGNWSQVVSLSSQANFQATTMGFGLTPTIGIGGGWMALDMNFTWNDIPQLAQPAFAFVFGPRLGKSFKLRKPESTISFWTGGFRLHLNSGTSGSLRIADVMPIDGLQAKVETGLVNVQNKQNQVDGWWAGLTPLEQKNPTNVIKYETANKALSTAGTFLGGLDAALNDSQY